MKKMILAVMAVAAFHSAYASEQDMFDLSTIGVGSVLKIERAILIPANKQEVFIAKIGLTDVRVIEDEVYRGNDLIVCTIGLTSKSNKVRRIVENTELKISAVSVTNNFYTLEVENDAIDSIDCKKGFASSDNDKSRGITAKEVIDDEYNIRHEESISVLEFNNELAGLASISPADAEDLGNDNSDRNAESASEGSSTEASANATQG